MEQVTTLSGHSGTVYALTWMHSPGGILVFSASYDRTIRVSSTCVLQGVTEWLSLCIVMVGYLSSHSDSLQ